MYYVLILHCALENGPEHRDAPRVRFGFSHDIWPSLATPRL